MSEDTKEVVKRAVRPFVIQEQVALEGGEVVWRDLPMEKAIANGAAGLRIMRKLAVGRYRVIQVSAEKSVAMVPDPKTVKALVD